MARTSPIDPIILRFVRDAGTKGATIAQLVDVVDQELGGTRGVRGVETQVRTLMEKGKLVRKFDYYYPVTKTGEPMKSPVRRYLYFDSTYGFIMADVERELPKKP